MSKISPDLIENQDRPEDSADEAQASASKDLDPFDPETLRVTAGSDIEVERVLTSVPVKKPKRDAFIRVHPEYVLDTLILERDSGMEKESYLVAPEVQDLVLQELRRTRLLLAVSNSQAPRRTVPPLRDPRWWGVSYARGRRLPGPSRGGKTAR
jgi:hypothetical protein